MGEAGRRRTTVAIAASTAAHLAVLAILATNTPILHVPPMRSGPPEPIIPVLILPRTPPPAAGEAAPAPIRLHRRPQRFRLEDLPLAPLPVPEAATAPSAPAREGPRRGDFHPAPLPEGPKDQLRSVLRRSDVGCANATAVGLNRTERENCDERLGKGAKDAPFIHPGFGMTRAKRAELEAAAARKSARVAVQERPVSPPVGLPDPQGETYDGEPHITGAGESLFGQANPPPSKRAARRLERLPP
ncbi:hypothetical protein [Phenylobacterium sp. J367]|uniref:hypothetical protein n=1 Tax=Phenylobacterium sp. J367 TaxID=2898435 RepID=UPI002151FDC8|nr:hypothetical protein [Phenylobacterium sp. J367]MCR5880783.1 hypothetical protein [Phenylobacterium sp. J367]